MFRPGIDLAQISRIRELMEHPRFLLRFFSAAERELFAQKNFSPQTVAANFAAKEAFSKALGTGIRGFSLAEVAVLRDELGCPYFQLSGNARRLVEERGYHMSVSLTHEQDYAAAVVICEWHGEAFPTTTAR